MKNNVHALAGLVIAQQKALILRHYLV
jgi:hypothetical protein